MSDPDEVRYGVFLVPDARTCAAVTDINAYLRAQYGLLSAGRFPPHVTLAGSLPIAVGEAELLNALRQVADRHAPIRLTNHGVDRLGDVLVFDVHHSDDDLPNEPLLDLVGAHPVVPLGGGNEQLVRSEDARVSFPLSVHR